MIGLDLRASAKLAVTWIILEYYYVVDLILDSIWIVLFFIVKNKPNIHDNIIGISNFQNGINNLFSSTVLYFKSKVIEGSCQGKIMFIWFWGTFSQSEHVWGCDIFFSVSHYQINSIFQWQYIFIRFMFLMKHFSLNY